MLKHITTKFKEAKIYIILLSMIFFSIIYTFLPDEDFSGVNNISELIKSELLKQKVLKDIKSNTNTTEGFEDFTNSNYKDAYNIDDSHEKNVKKIETIVESEYTPENVNKSFIESYFSRIYFSIITGCLLGYGDVYPVSMRAKTLVMLQSLFTIIIIVS